MTHAPFAAETLHHEQRNGCTISNGHDAPRSAVSMHHPVRRIHWLEKLSDPLLADAICDRIVHDANTVVIGGKESMRKREGLQDI